MMSDFDFENPLAINLIWIVLALVGVLIWLELRGNRKLDQFLSKLMQDRLVRRLSTARRITAVVLLGLAMASFVVALMRPQWGFKYLNVPKFGAQIMVCLDVSKSMLAEDARPNRLERAKLELIDLLGLMDGDQIGLTAFAGKAAVLCPMTSDFGFLKLLLDDVGPHSVGQGGTRLAEPIKKAVEGFGEAADISRVIMLITDGGDQDSYPLEAAKLAKERGVRIITIGFGDENGTRIQITSPQTGATDFVRDDEGNPVVSKLDGALLRSIALETDGAYIPAGTGALDLESIYREHVAGLIRNDLESGKQLIRNEAFQIPITIGLLFLFAALLTRSRSNSLSLSASKIAKRAAVVTAALLFACEPEVTQAQVGSAVGDPTANTAANTATASGGTLNTAELQDPEPSTNTVDESSDDAPRELYNQSLAFLDTDLDKADSLLQQARTDAGTDGEVRYRSAYNLGWVMVKRADKQMEADPKAALSHLQQAADWFGKAIRIRPKANDARHNMEVVMRRIVELNDALAKQDDKDLAKKLDELIEQQRQLLGESGSLVEMIRARTEADPDAQFFKKDFRGLAVKQRQLLSDTEKTLDRANTELQQLQDAKPEELKDEQRIRLGQLGFVATYLQKATQRMGQSRSQLRLRRDLRAFRRQSLSLNMLKRARDGLRPPDQRIRSLMADSTELTQRTNLFAMNTNQMVDKEEFHLPAWLTKELLDESQKIVTERSSELSQLLKAAVEAGSKEDDQSATANNDADEPNPKVSQQELDNWSEIAGFIETAHREFKNAELSMSGEKWTDAVESQIRALESLEMAEERLLELRGLIEKSFATETQVQQLLQVATSDSDDVPPEANFDEAALFESIRKVQEQNLDRMVRIEEKIERQLHELDAQANAPSTPPDPAAADPNAAQQAEQAKQAAQAESERLKQATKIAADARREMESANESFAAIETNNNTKVEPDSEVDSADEDSADEASADEDSANKNSADEDKPEAELSDSKNELEEPSEAESEPANASEAPQRRFSKELKTGSQHVDNSIKHLQELRRLFYSIVERLRESAQKQSEINDTTQELAELNEEDTQRARREQVSSDQTTNRTTALQIANELAQQAEAAAASAQHGPQPPPSQTGGTQPAAQDPSKQFQQASNLVKNATQFMADAEEQLDAESNFELKAVRDKQDLALQELIKALQLLQPPNQDNQDQQQNQDQKQEPKQEPQNDQGDSQQQPQQNQSVNQLLQIVRDQEAKRRKEKSRKARAIQGARSGSDW